MIRLFCFFFFFSSRRRHTRSLRDWSSDVCSSDLQADVSKLEDMRMAVREAKARFSEIHGVIHCAGVNRDAFILKKDRKSTRLNSSHVEISYAVFCLKKKIINQYIFVYEFNYFCVL